MCGVFIGPFFFFPTTVSKTCTWYVCILHVYIAAGTHATPLWPRLPGLETFRGTQIHSSQYRHADDFRGKRVAVVGAGNSGAQILAEVSAPGVASSALWSTLEEPSFLPMGLSGKEIFDTGESARDLTEVNRIERADVLRVFFCVLPSHLHWTQVPSSAGMKRIDRTYRNASYFVLSKYDVGTHMHVRVCVALLSLRFSCVVE